MNQSGKPSRWRPSMNGPVRLIKSDGQFSGSSSLKPKGGRKSRSTVSGFTAGVCLPAGSLERPNIRSLNCNQSCPAGYGSYGYDGTQWNYESACNMYNMICIKSDYEKDNWTAVSDCCNGVTAQKDCDSTLCPLGQGCRDKMTEICNKPDVYGTAQCQTWLARAGNEDMLQTILGKQCTAEMFASGQCRNFALDPKSHGLMDAEVTKWCTPGQIKNPSGVDPKLSEWARYRLRNGPEPSWAYFIYSSNRDAGIQQWDGQMNERLFQMGGINSGHNDANVDALITPPVTYRDNSQDKICACIASPLNKLGSAVAPPTCFDTSCQAGGYRTGTMKAVSQKCPSYTDCRTSVAAVAGGTNQQVNIQQICGSPPIVPGVVTNAGTIIPPGSSTPVSGSAPGQKDDKQLLLDDEARAAAAKSGPPPRIDLNVTPGLADQLNKPFMPGQFGDMSIASVGILFFALVILSAILWRTWANRQSQDFAERLQAEQIRADQNLQNSGPEATVVNDAVRAQLNNMTPVGVMAM